MKMESTWASVLTCIVVAASVAWAVKLVNLVWLRPRKLEKLLRQRGLDGNPYSLVDLRDMIKAEQSRSVQLSDETLPHVFAYYHDILHKYGENCFLWLGRWPKLIVVDPELIKEILRKPEAFQKPLPELSKMVVGGLLLLEG